MSEWLGRTTFVLAVGTCVFLGLQTPNVVNSQTRGNAGADPSSVQMKSTLLQNGVEQVLVFDDSARTIAVYHIDPTTGTIQLKSVRSLAWDLRLEEFNGKAPLPSDLRQIQP